MPVKYDDFIKRPLQEYSYSPEEVAALSKCSQDIWEFLKYVKIIHPDRGRIAFEPYPYQRKILKILQDERFVIGLWSRQSGKALALDTPLPQPNGKWTTIGDVQVGDFLIGRDGKPTKVVFVTEVMENHNCYEIEFDNGERIVVDEEHLWCVGSSNFGHKNSQDNPRTTHEERVLTTKEIFDKFSNTSHSYYINYHSGVVNDDIELPVDPYILGIWLGEGHLVNGRISTSINDYNEISKIIQEKYLTSSFKKDWRNENGGYFNVYKLMIDLRKINLINNKHIPKVYFSASINQKLELIRGLMDTNGYCGKDGVCEFSQKSSTLIEDIREIFSSIGIKTKLNYRVINGERYHSLVFSTTRFSVFNLSRKKDRQTKCFGHDKNTRIYIKNIIKVNSVPVKCIQVDNDEHLFLCGKTMIPTHNTTTVCAYALWYAIFNPDKIVGIASNKQISAIDILSRLKIMYEELPVWLKPGVQEYSKTFVNFDNGSKIMVSATSPDSFRGRTINLLILDEFAFVQKNKAEEFWSSNLPTIAASSESRVVIISTPNGMFNLYHRLYTQAERKENTFVAIKSTWKDVPGRDRKWASDQRKNLGKQKFIQEYECEFLGSTNTVIDSDIIEKLYDKCTRPIVEQANGKLKIYEKPVEKAVYVIGVDTAKGTGENYSTMQVLKIVQVKPIILQQVATFNDNYIDVYTFADIVNRTSIYYNSAFIMAENNAEGSTVVTRLWWEYENPGLVNSGSKTKDLGVRADRRTKPRAVMLMKKLVEDGSLTIVDYDTVDQISTFIEKEGKFFGKDMPDDLITALYWGCYFTTTDMLEESFEIKKTEIEDDVWGVLSDIEPIAEDWSWLSRTGKLIN
ncbi:MAG TPA: terminase family protein [Bacteroidales bacterium]|nr:terminase family protein [Bacteroidales bacterium]